jgi:Zn-dependent peptidase ImmA (M78 family)
MAEAERPRPLKEANRITQVLDVLFGEDRFDRHPVNIRGLALEYSKQIEPKGPIHVVEERDLEGCMGALVYSEQIPRQWGIAYHKGQSPGRRAFTVGHEFGHFVLHRTLIETDPRFAGGIFCDEASILQRDGKGIEHEADTFAAAVLMPLHDYRRQLPARERPDFERLSRLAERYGVSLTAVTLRWLEYTETRAIMIVSNDGFARWAKPSAAALKSGRFIRTKSVTYELPVGAIAVRREFTEEVKSGIIQPSGTWGFPEALIEMCVRSDRYDQEITLLHFDSIARVFEDEPVEDTYDRFARDDLLA